MSKYVFGKFLFSVSFSVFEIESFEITAFEIESFEITAFEIKIGPPDTPTLRKSDLT